MKRPALAMAAAVAASILSCEVPQPSTTTREMLFVTWAQPGQGMASSYLIDPTSGALAEAPGSPFSTGGTVNPSAISLTLAHGGRFLFAADPVSGDPAVSGFYVNAFTGTCNPLPPYSFNNTDLVTTDSSGLVLLADSQLSGSLSSFRIDAIGGTLTFLASVPVLPTTVAVDPAAPYVYTTDAASAIGGFIMDPVAGLVSNPSFIALTSSEAVPISAAIDSQGRLYFLTDGSGKIEVYAINAATGSLTLLYLSTSLPQGGPSRIVIDPTGRFLYSVDVAGSVSAYSIDYATGALSSTGSPVLVPGPLTGPLQPVIDPSGRFLYASESAAGSDFYCFTINPATGAINAGSAVKTTIPGDSNIAALAAGSVTVPSR